MSTTRLCWKKWQSRGRNTKLQWSWFVTFSCTWIVPMCKLKGESRYMNWVFISFVSLYGNIHEFKSELRISCSLPLRRNEQDYLSMIVLCSRRIFPCCWRLDKPTFPISMNETLKMSFWERLKNFIVWNLWSFSPTIPPLTMWARRLAEWKKKRNAVLLLDYPLRRKLHSVKLSRRNSLNVMPVHWWTWNAPDLQPCSRTKPRRRNYSKCTTCLCGCHRLSIICGMHSVIESRRKARR
mmetsp:Transcript_1028/g.1919  ORF Transcript_1028/g.1919 Transcript_1028/m.1919 type:complete len:238 (-) Transcript_1028:1487-2200(-)